MSTKIYNGYLVEGIKTIEDLFSFAFQAKETLTNVSKEIQKKTIANSTVNIVDCTRFDIDPPKKDTLKSDNIRTAAYYYVYNNSKNIEQTQLRDPLFDFNACVAFSFVNGRLLARTFIEQSRMEDTWRAMDGVKFYGWWDNADPDEDCTRKEWNQRKRDWNKLIDQTQLATIFNLSFDTMRPYGLNIYMHEDVSQYFPSDDKRIEAMTASLLQEEFTVSRKDLLDLMEKEGNYRKFYKEYRKYCQEDSTIERQDALRQKVAKHLVPIDEIYKRKISEIEVVKNLI